MSNAKIIILLSSNCQELNDNVAIQQEVCEDQTLPPTTYLIFWWDFFVCWFIFKITVIFKSIGIVLSHFSWSFKEYIFAESIS